MQVQTKNIYSVLHKLHGVVNAARASSLEPVRVVEALRRKCYIFYFFPSTRREEKTRVKIMRRANRGGMQIILNIKGRDLFVPEKSMLIWL